ncbi:hypothetical protein GA0070618_6657 [Micromonospora echinospora]|uniref:Uncharacterized protein n=2 Tax=Micromonospora echinospora TaxID=1877 RepID=A0A1C5AB80_MICEC|nr:hypothetical protein GA0070618_6657 [Micromonospora echinospora]
MDGCEVYVMADETVVKTEHLRILFDALCHSLDFGSGFLDTEEVNALRAIAGYLGVNPMVATPSEFVTQYTHDFEASDAPTRPGKCWASGPRYGQPETPEEFAARVAEVTARCRYCTRPADAAPHPQKETA